MILYHEADTGSVALILKEGMKRTSRGEKGDDESIVRTDKFLDAYRPDDLVASKVSRDDNVYAYLGSGGQVVDITSGELVELEMFIDRAEGEVLSFEVDATRCFVSDLDIYDGIKKAVENGMENIQMAQHYWESLVSLADYKLGQIRRPEAMIPYDIPPEAIRRLG